MQHLFYLALAYVSGICTYRLLLFLQKKTIDDKKRKILQQACLKRDEILSQAEIKITKRYQKLEAKVFETEQKLLKEQKELQREKEALQQEKKKLRPLEEIASFTKEEAKEKILSDTKKRLEKRVFEMSKQADDDAENKAFDLLISAMNRISEKLHETTYRTISLTDEKQKAKIIGPGGKNFDAFTRYSGVDLIIDDTLTIFVSSFHPEKLETAYLALQKLLESGKIYPESIQEKIIEAKNEVIESCKAYAEPLIGHLSLHPKLFEQVSKMRLFQTSGQNLLCHSLEVSQLMGQVAEALSLDRQLAEKIGLFHDIGKTFNTGSHAKIGAQFVAEFERDTRLLEAIEYHHDSKAILCPEAMLLKPADTLSSIRKGARKSNTQDFHDRIEKLEEIARSFNDVDHAHVADGGRKLFVFVRSDSSAQTLEKMIQDKIESETNSLVVVQVVSQD